MAKEKKIEFPNPNFQLYERVDDEKHMLKYEGSYNFMGVKAVFSVTDQYPFNLKTPSNRVNCRYRGTASIRDPQRNGKVLRLQGEKAACALNDYYMKHPEEKSNPKTDSDVLKIAETINFNGGSAQELAEFIFSKCTKMLEKYQDQLVDCVRLHVQPATISPGEAAYIYTDQFLNKRHAKAAEETRTAIRNTIFKFFKRMENKPMSRFTKREINKFVTTENISDSAKNTLHQFWGYCLERHYCEGDNPFERSTPKKFSPEAQARKSKQKSYLAQSEREYIFQRLKVQPNAYACLVALGLFCGLPIETALELTWDKIHFEKGVGWIELMDTDLDGDRFTCATHNYSFVMMPQAYEILHKYKETLETQEKCDISHKRIAGDPAITKVALNKFVETLMAQMVVLKIGGTAFPSKSGYSVLVETYRMMIELECGIQDDEGTKRFLQHRPMTGLVTDDHYVSYTDAEARDRQYMILKRQAPKKNNSKGKIDLKNGDVRYYPDSNKERLLVCMDVEIQPGECLAIDSGYTIEGKIMSRDTDDEDNNKNEN